MLPVAGLKAATEGRFGEAETLFKVFLNGDPNSASGWSNLGNVHLSTGRAALALEDFDHAISLAPEVRLQPPADSLKRHAAVSEVFCKSPWHLSLRPSWSAAAHSALPVNALCLADGLVSPSFMLPAKFPGTWFACL